MTSPTPSRADLLARHLDLHRQAVAHRVIGSVDVDEDGSVSYDGWECTACDWYVPRSGNPSGGCPARRALNTEIVAVVEAIQALDAEPATTLASEAA